jgi:5-methylcytosine-specific restriction endonuclease McrA
MTNGNGSLLATPVLVLNASYEPIHVCAARRALVLLLKGVAAAEELSALQVHSTSRAIDVPSVIRLLEYRRIPRQTRALSRKNILVRDRHICQYCERSFSAVELTLDHVVPRSRGGSSSWENLVTCCRRCNHRQGDRLPDEVGRWWTRRPRPGNLHTSRSLMRLLGNQQTTWRKYLFY